MRARCCCVDEPPRSPESPRLYRPSRWPLAGLALVALAYVVWVLSLPEDTFWAGDMGVKLLQVEGLTRSSFRSLALDYPGEHVDPEGAYFPITRLFAARVHGRWYAVFPPLFAILTAPLYLAFGNVGLYVLPAASAVAVLYLSLLLARHAALGPHEVYLPVAIGLGSPLFLYAVVFWEHSLATMLCLAAFALMLRPAGSKLFRVVSVLVGVLMGVASAMRPECYWFTVGLIAASMVWHGRKGWQHAALIGAGACAASAASCTLNAIAFGHPLGLHYVLNVREAFGQAPSTSARLAQAGANAIHMLLNPSTQEIVNVWTLAPLGLFLAACWFRRRWAVIACGILALPTLAFFALEQHIKEGLFAVTPVCIFWLAGWPFHRPDDTRRFRLTATLVLLVFTSGVILTSPTPGGWQFGPRLLLPAYPLLLILSIQGLIALKGHAPQKLVIAVFFASLCVGFVAAFRALQVADQNKRDWQLLARAFRQSPAQVIVTDRPYFPQNLASLYYDKPSFLIRDPQGDATDLLSRLAGAGVKRLMFVSNSEHMRFDPDRVTGFRQVEEMRRRTFRHTTTFREYILVP